MRELYIDIETYSSVDIGSAGAYRYAQSEDFAILLFAYKADEDPVVVIDLTDISRCIPDHIIQALTDPSVIKHAYNAAFEWWCLNQAGYRTPIEQWRCTMIHGLYCGYPAGLDATGKAIGLPADKQKLTTGKALIKYFCAPCKPTKANGGRTRNLPHHDPDKWKLFMQYNGQDVEAEYAIEQRLRSQSVPESVWREWHHDVLINARGVRVDSDLVNGALYIDDLSTEELIEASYRITGIDNPKSNGRMLEWVQNKCSDLTIDNLQKETVEDLLDNHADELPESVAEALRLRQMINKTSVSKYAAMAESKGPDDRIRGLDGDILVKAVENRQMQLGSGGRRVVDAVDIDGQVIVLINLLISHGRGIVEPLHKSLHQSFVFGVGGGCSLCGLGGFGNIRIDRGFRLCFIGRGIIGTGADGGSHQHTQQQTQYTLHINLLLTR